MHGKTKDMAQEKEINKENKINLRMDKNRICTRT